jgi:hypothetical protein
MLMLLLIEVVGADTGISPGSLCSRLLQLLCVSCHIISANGSCCCCAAASAAAGTEPAYTSSHALFMDTCDYIWYTEQLLTKQQLQEKQLKQNCAEDSDVACSRGEMGTKSEVSINSHSGRSSSYQLRPVAVLEPIDGLRLAKGLPGRWMGSDHVSLVTDFELRLVDG